jgi:hypothetical protein
MSFSTRKLIIVFVIFFFGMILYDHSIFCSTVAKVCKQPVAINESDYEQQLRREVFNSI